MTFQDFYRTLTPMTWTNDPKPYVEAAWDHQQHRLGGLLKDCIPHLEQTLGEWDDLGDEEMSKTVTDLLKKIREATLLSSNIAQSL